MRRGGARKCSRTEDVLLAASTEVEVEGIDAIAEALAKQMTDGRTVDGGTRVPDGPKYVGVGEKEPNNHSE